MSSFVFILKEQVKNIYLIKRLANFEIRIANTNNYLGTAWELINPMIQIAIYWFIFGLRFKKQSANRRYSLYLLVNSWNKYVVFY